MVWCAPGESAEGEGTAMAPGEESTIWEVDDALGAELRPLLAAEKPRKKQGAPREGDRRIFNGLIWIARTSG